MKSFWVLLVMAAFCLLILTMQAGAEGSGSIRLELPAEAQAVEMTLYQVGALENDGFRCSGAFAGSGIAIPSMENAAALEQAAKELASYAEKHAIAGTARQGSVSGGFYYDGLAPALYLLAQTGGRETLEVQSLFVPIPCGDSSGSVSWQVDAKPKYTVPDRTASLTVQKRLTDISGDEVCAENGIFYVALFDDANRTNRVSDVKAIHFKNSSTSSVTFEELKVGGTYYVGETDQNGTLLDHVEVDGSVCTPVFPNGYEVTPVQKEKPEEFSFENVFVNFPKGYYYPYKLTVTKRVKKDGKKYRSNGVFYAGIFEDEEHTTLVSDVIKLEMNGKDECSVTVEGFAEADMDAAKTYYIAETDEDGRPLENGIGLSFEISQDKDSVSYDGMNTERTVVITNNYQEEPETEIVQNRGTGNPSDTSSVVKTGDDTPVAEVLFLLLAAAAVITGAVIYKRKRIS